MRTLRQVALALGLCAAAASTSWAHAFLDHAEPAVGSQAHGAPTAVKLWFTEKVEPALSRVQVFDAAGREVDRKDGRLDPADGRILSVSLPALSPGKFKVAWRVVAVDTHVTSGSFNFEVLP